MMKELEEQIESSGVLSKKDKENALNFINNHNPMTPKDVIAQAEKWRREWLTFRFTDMTKTNVQLNQEADWWLSKFDTYTKDLLQSVVEACCNYYKRN